MKRKCLLGAAAIFLAALAILTAIGCFQRKKTLNCIEELHFYEENRYCVDREKNSFRIFRTDIQGKSGSMIRCARFRDEEYHRLQQMFFDDQGEAYVLLEEIKVSSFQTSRCKIFHCDFGRGKLVETAYDLTECIKEGSSVHVQRIQDGKVYYIQVRETQEDSGEANVCTMDREGKMQKLDTVSLKYPFLKAQFFLSQDQVLLWMDYSGQIFVKELGSDSQLEIEGITGIKNTFMNLSDDGKRNGYVFDSQSECVRRIDLKAMTGEIIPRQEEVKGQASDPAFWEWMSKEGSVTLSFGALFGRLLPVMGVLFLAGTLLWVLWYIYCKYHVQTILARLALVFILGLLLTDYVLEWWLGQTIQTQLDRSQTLTMAVMGEQLREHITERLEENKKQFPLGSQDWALSRSRLGESQKAGEVNEMLPYVYTILKGGKEGQLKISESMWEYKGILAQYHYSGSTLEVVNQCYESGKSVSHKQQNQNGTWNTRFLPILLSDGTIYGVLSISSATDFLDYRIWQYQRNLRFASMGLLLTLSFVLLFVLALFLMPLRNLKKSAQKLAEGELGATVPVHGHDEIADISRVFNQMSLGIARQVEDIQSMSDGYYRFIPAKILELLGKESIQQVKLGDEITVHMTILSMHAPNYPKQGRMRPPQEVYREINEILAVLEDPIAEHHGVVEHFEDNGLSAFFTENSGEALKAAIEIHRSLDDLGYGERRAIAITYGKIMTGVIGYESRMEVSTISVHSDLAKSLRLKGNDYGARILLTHPAYQQISDFERQYHARYLGNVSLNGGALERVYDVYDGDREEDFYYKELTKPLFEHGVELFLAKKFYEARLVFVEVLKQYRKDKAAKEYLYRCDKYYKEPEGKTVETVIERF